MKKLKPNIAQTFEVDVELMNDLDFNFVISNEKVKKASKIVIVKKPVKRKKDGSTGRLF